jgi:glycosyltransferase involved in cell wall biosynthesis
MRERVRERGLEQHVKLPGWLDELARDAAFAEADVFVLPTYREGMPLSIMQAMSVGLPVISTDVDGVPQIARDGVNALIHKPGDVAGLANRMERLGRDAALRARLGRESLRIAESELTVEKTMSHVADLFEDILEGRTPRTAERTGE